jgi:putative transposase
MGQSGSSNQRRSIRLPGYDYSQAGAYFVTMVTRDRRCLFGRVKDGDMELNEMGKMVENVWLEIPEHFDGVYVDMFVVMPNHIHGVIEIIKDNRSSGVGATHESPLPTQGHGPKPGSIGVIVGLFKATISKQYHMMTNTQDTHLWQRNYFEHVIRDEIDYQAIHDYILSNPLNWEKDEEYQG